MCGFHFLNKIFFFDFRRLSHSGRQLVSSQSSRPEMRHLSSWHHVKSMGLAEFKWPHLGTSLESAWPRSWRQAMESASHTTLAFYQGLCGIPPNEVSTIETPTGLMFISLACPATSLLQSCWVRIQFSCVRQPELT